MRKLIFSLHSTLDGFAGAENGSLDWVRLDDDLFDLVGTFTEKADTALYGRITWQLMDNYWPRASEKPNASKHDRQHSQWYNSVEKLVISRTLQAGNSGNTRFISGDIPSQIRKLKNGPGKNILMLGSLSASRILMEQALIDEYWFFLNPIILGKGIPAFSGLDKKIVLNLMETRVFRNGVLGLHYSI